jgi:hypothetical protein
VAVVTGWLLCDLLIYRGCLMALVSVQVCVFFLLSLLVCNNRCLGACVCVFVICVVVVEWLCAFLVVCVVCGVCCWLCVRVRVVLCVSV